MKKRLAVLGVAVCAIGLAACSPSGSGTIRGTFFGAVSLGDPECIVGQPCPHPIPAPGVITFVNKSGTYETLANARGRFTITLPPGTYSVWGRLRHERLAEVQSGCKASRPVTVTPGGASTIAVPCLFM